MRNLELGQIEVDEIWGFIGKKQKNFRRKDRQAISWGRLDVHRSRPENKADSFLSYR